VAAGDDQKSIHGAIMATRYFAGASGNCQKCRTRTPCLFRMGGEIPEIRSSVGSVFLKFQFSGLKETAQLQNSEFGLVFSEAGE
jgi:hypothetical protein